MKRTVWDALLSFALPATKHIVRTYIFGCWSRVGGVGKVPRILD